MNIFNLYLGFWGRLAPKPFWLALIVVAVIVGINLLLWEFWETDDNTDLWTCSIIDCIAVYMFSALTFKRIMDTCVPVLAILSIVLIGLEAWYESIILSSIHLKPFPFLSYMAKHADTLRGLSIAEDVLYLLLFILSALPRKKKDKENLVDGNPTM